MAHIISSPTPLKTLSHLEQGAGTYYSGTQAWNYRVCVSVSSPQSVCMCSCLCDSLADRNRVGNYSGTNLMKTLFIWCYSLSYQSLTGYQRGWWIVFPSERWGRRGRDVCLLPLCRVSHHFTLSRLQHAASNKKKKIMFKSSVVVSQSVHFPFIFMKKQVSN